MKIKKIFFFIVLPLLLICSLFSFFFFYSNSNNQTNTVSESSSTKEDFLNKQPTHPNNEGEKDSSLNVSVYIINDKDFPSSKNVTVIHSSIEDDFSEHRFILLPFEYEATYEEQKILYDWILKGKTVAYYGHDLDSSQMSRKLNLPLQQLAGKPIGTNINFVFLLYGFGYSYELKEYTPIFHLVQDNYTNNLGSLYEVLHDYLIDKNDF